MQFRVDQPQYQGPIDLLTSLSHERDLPLESISLAEIVRSYRQQLRLRDDVHLSEVGDFVLLEARLIRLKAAWQRMVPEMPDEEQEPAVFGSRDPAAAKGARFLRSRAAIGILMHPAAMPLSNYPREAIVEAMQRLQRRAETRIGRRLRLRAAPRLQFRRVLSWLRQALRRGERVEVAGIERPRGERVLEFIAALELGRLGEALIDQEHFFAPIYIVRRDADLG